MVLAWMSLALATPTVGQYFVTEDLMKLVATEQEANWHPNRLASSLWFVSGEELEADLTDGEPVRCPYSVQGSSVVATCQGERWQIAMDGPNLVVSHRWGQEVLAPSSRSVDRIFRDDVVRRTKRLLPALAGTWKRNGERMEVVPALAKDPTKFRIDPCIQGDRKTTCIQVQGEAFVLSNEQYTPVELRPGDDGGEFWFVVEDSMGSAWVRDTPCMRGICEIVRTRDGESLAWTPQGPKATDALSPTSNLLGGTLAVTTALEVSRVEVSLRAHTRGALHRDYGPVGWGDLNAATEPIVLPRVNGRFAVPERLEAAPATLTPTEAAKRTRAALAGRADEVAIARYAVAVLDCETLDTRPCVLGIGALEFEITAFGASGAVDSFTLVLERGFGC